MSKFKDRSFTWFLNYLLAKFLEIFTTGSLEIGKSLRRQSVSPGNNQNCRSQFSEQLRMRLIKLGSSVGCSRVPQVHFVRKQTMFKSVNTHLTV